MKQFSFVNAAARRAYLALPEEIQQRFGLDLFAVQKGLAPFSAFKDISDSVGRGVVELIENGSPAYRAVYCCKYLDTVYVLHAFTKTTNGVDRKAMETAAVRYKEMMQQVRAASRSALRES